MRSSTVDKRSARLSKRALPRLSLCRLSKRTVEQPVCRRVALYVIEVIELPVYCRIASLLSDDLSKQALQDLPKSLLPVSTLTERLPVFSVLRVGIL